ncbi:MAG TPA: NAD(P)H-dependent oxidoreductase subunit E, partial [Nitrospirota bacterium]
TTKDGRFTLFEVECIGSCGKGPAITINDDFHYNLTASKVDEIFERYR